MPQRRFSFRQLKGGVRRRKSLVVAKRMPTPGPAPNPETPRPLVLVFGGLVALAAAVGIGRFVYTPILPLMVSEHCWPWSAPRRHGERGITFLQSGGEDHRGDQCVDKGCHIACARRALLEPSCPLPRVPVYY
jgi:hypothetical protein